MPWFLVHFEHQPRDFRLLVKPASGPGGWTNGIFEEYLPRNSTSTSFFAFSWDGDGYADGDWLLKVCVRKAPGSPNIQECVNLPEITIDRP
jgi:hypothetical protein